MTGALHIIFVGSPKMQFAPLCDMLQPAFQFKGEI